MTVRSRLPWLAMAATLAATCALAALSIPAGASTTSADDPSGGVVIDDITIDVPSGPDVAAYVVRPSGHLGAQSQAGSCSCTGSVRSTTTGPSTLPRP